MGGGARVGVEGEAGRSCEGAERSASALAEASERQLTSMCRGRPRRGRVQIANLDGGGKWVGRNGGRLERDEARGELGETTFGRGRVVAGNLKRFNQPVKSGLKSALRRRSKTSDYSPAELRLCDLVLLRRRSSHIADLLQRKRRPIGSQLELKGRVEDHVSVGSLRVHLGVESVDLERLPHPALALGEHLGQRRENWACSSVSRTFQKWKSHAEQVEKVAIVANDEGEMILGVGVVGVVGVVGLVARVGVRVRVRVGGGGVDKRLYVEDRRSRRVDSGEEVVNAADELFDRALGSCVVLNELAERSTTIDPPSLRAASLAKILWHAGDQHWMRWRAVLRFGWRLTGLTRRTRRTATRSSPGSVGMTMLAW